MEGTGAFMLAELRRSAGWTQLYVAEKIGTQKSAVSQWESGKTKRPSAVMARRLDDLFQAGGALAASWGYTMNDEDSVNLLAEHEGRLATLESQVSTLATQVERLAKQLRAR